MTVTYTKKIQWEQVNIKLHSGHSGSGSGGGAVDEKWA